ncbi:hypothetical protein DNTS_032807 [Danionella cerebrum]|uniref:RNA-editing substrate-binding complex 6 protein domain-containing protein n=1 Tax=Danionella cerebrum TaxID=2873325 RepID=A0A553PXP7_9TELE|nr:hypothetical protein DNTS_032807 [Danionella translucida]
MNMHKSGLGMLRCALRSTLLWKCDISTMKLVPLCYKVKSLASTQPRSDKSKALASKSIRYYCHSASDAAKESTAATATTEVPQNEAENNPLLVYLAQCKSPMEVLDELNRYPISVNEIAKIFYKMWQFTKEMPFEQRQREFKLINEHPEFSALCERLTIEAGALENKFLVRTLRVTVNLAVSHDSRVVQTLLRIAQEHLNQFDLDSLCILSRTLHEMKSSNAQPLREAIRLLLLDHIPETSNVKTLTILMKAVGKDSPLELKKQLASKVFSLSSEFTSADHFYVFSGLANIDLNHTPLLDTCSKKLAENLHDYSFTQLLTVLRCCHEGKYRNHTLFSSISKHMADTIDTWRDQQEHLNQFDLKSLRILYGTLHEMKSSNAQPLREAIRLLLLDRFPETSNVATLTTLMYAVGEDSPLELKKQLASKVFSLSSEFTSADHFHIFTGLANIGLNHTPLLDTCSKKLAENLHDYSFTKLLKVLKCCHEVKYRNYTLFSSISKHMADTIDTWRDQQVLKILQPFEKLNFRPVELLDVLAEKIIQDPENLPINDLLIALRLFSMANHDLKDIKTECTVNLAVSHDSRVVQTLLRVAQEHLNQFDLKSLRILYGTLHEMKSSNAQPLREAIRLLLLDRFPETSNVPTLTTLMHAVGEDSPLELKKQLASKVFSLSSEFTSADHFYIFSGLANIGLKHTPLLDTCSKKLAENLHDYSFTQLLTVLKCCHEVKYRNHTLFSSISKHMADTIDTWRDQQVPEILQAFEELNFRPVELLDVLAERIIQDPENLPINKLLIALRGFSMANHDLKDIKTE